MASTPPAEKSSLAFRTIGEASEAIGVPQHVLRFWETRFPQLQPLKRGGNRRYYRPADMALLETIRAMLHDEGLTIRGVQLALAARRLTPGRVGEAPTAPVAVPDSPPAASPSEAAGPVMASAMPAEFAARLAAIRDGLKLALAA